MIHTQSYTLLCVMSAMLCAISLSAQEAVYDYSFKKRKTDFLVSTAFFAASQWHNASLSRKVIDDEIVVSSKSLWVIDRYAIRQNSSSADRWSDVTLYAALAMPILLNLKKHDQRKGIDIALMGLQGFFIENGLNLFTKNLVQRPRPFVFDNPGMVKDRGVNLNSNKSFYSGHTSGAAYFAFFGAKVFSDLHPDSHWKPYVWGAAITIPAVTGFLRYKAGKHFPTDVIVGYIAGASIGYLIPQIYKNKKTSLSMSPGGMSLVVGLD